MKEKRVECHLDKTSIVIIGSKKFKDTFKEELRDNTPIFNTFTVKEKVFYKFLGDLLHTECLSASVQATVKEREGNIKQAMMEI